MGREAPGDEGLGHVGDVVDADLELVARAHVIDADEEGFPATHRELRRVDRTGEGEVEQSGLALVVGGESSHRAVRDRGSNEEMSTSTSAHQHNINGNGTGQAACHSGCSGRE